jgi:AAA domain
MNAPITLKQLEALNAALEANTNEISHENRGTLLNKLSVNTPPPETQTEIARVKSALTFVSPDVGRGNGSFYSPDGQATTDNWLAVIWAIQSLQWSCSKQVAREWSTQCPSRFTEEGFEKAWADYDPSHATPIGIGSLYKRVKELGWNEQAVKKQTLQPRKRYELLSAKQLELFPQLQWVIKRVLPREGIAAIYGPSGSGKSFLALDAGLAIAQGKSWFSKRVKTLPVVYVGLEGEAGIKNRIQAWQQMHQCEVPDTFYFVLKQSFYLNDSEDVSALAKAAPQGSVIIIDTLNRAAPTADENSSEDMGQILEGAKTLQALTGGLVLIVHHTGKDTSRGARGHSSFFAALDAAIEVKHDLNMKQRSWSVAKSKDSDAGIQRFFDLKSYNVGIDEDLDPIDSCAILENVGMTATRKPPSGAQEKHVMAVLRQSLAKSTNRGLAGAPSHVVCIREDEAIYAVAATLKASKMSKNRAATRVRISKLVTESHISRGLEQGDAWLWLPE